MLFFLDWICKVREWPIRVQNKSLSNVWIYDQLHTQAEAFTREIHDEQRVGKFYNFIGMDSLFISPFLKYSQALYGLLNLLYLEPVSESLSHVAY